MTKLCIECEFKRGFYICPNCSRHSVVIEEGRYVCTRCEYKEF